MEVLFTFLAERNERRSVIITSNVVFSESVCIFKDPMTTAASIDRLVHHPVSLEMTGSNVRALDPNEHPWAHRQDLSAPRLTHPPRLLKVEAAAAQDESAHATA
jgi:hypothetical protein